MKVSRGELKPAICWADSNQPLRLCK
jgi:hypothetical protein